MEDMNDILSLFLLAILDFLYQDGSMRYLIHRKAKPEKISRELGDVLGLQFDGD